MNFTTHNTTNDKPYILQIWDKGIDDMENDRELPIENAFQKISELRKQHRDAQL